MLSNIIVATAVLATAPFAHAVGTAIVKNGCNYPVKLSNVPASGGGYEEINMSLEAGATYSQQYTELTNGNGWSIKLSPDEDLNHILQYEYTYHNDGTIWYDLSEVDGNPWDGNWEITATGSDCSPRQAAYRYSTDDAYGMQSCPDDATITVLLCSGESQNDAGASSASSAAPSSTYVAPSSTYVAPTTTSAASASSGVALVVGAGGSVVESASSATDVVVPVVGAGGSVRGSWRQRVAAKPTTLATIARTSTTDNNVVTVTSVVITYATETAFAKRHEHHAHPHARV